VADCAALRAIRRCSQADLEDEQPPRARCCRAWSRAFGSVDAVVHSAALFEHDEAAQLQLRAHGAHMRAATPARPSCWRRRCTSTWRARAQGAVVNLLDQKLWNPNPDFLSYTLSKAALEAATPMLAQALAPHCAWWAWRPASRWPATCWTQDKFEQLHKLSPLGRSSTPEDVVATVRFALENRSITGTTLLVDGGQHLMKFERDFSLM
jgi:NAD(P)-dependent dehydrogenase (short-subunit alcohol dehydrogenase family)